MSVPTAIWLRSPKGEALPPILGAMLDISAKGAFIESECDNSLGTRGVMELILPSDIGPRISGNIDRQTSKGVAFKFDWEHKWVLSLLE